MCASPETLPYASDKPGDPGFQVELGRAIAEGLKLSLSIEWIVPRRRANVANCDMQLDSVNNPEMYKGRALLSRPYQRSGVVLGFAPGIEPVQDYKDLPKDRNLDEPAALLAEARATLRAKFLAADVGITGANFLIAETGTSIIVTNEGNGDLTQTLPRVHIVLASIEKVVPTLEDVSLILRLLARSATGQDISTYTTFSTGPRRPGDPDGPQQYHVVLVDNGRSEIIGSELRPVLRCIRCGACMNHCPVYQAIGGHAYGAVYAGPIGAVLTPALNGATTAMDLPNASSFCGRCEEVCPMQIPLPGMMRHLRERQVAMAKAPATQRVGLSVWSWLAQRPILYRVAARAGTRVLELMAGRRGRLRRLPFAGGWTRYRDMPAPEGRTFRDLWAERCERRARS